MTVPALGVHNSVSRELPQINADCVVHMDQVHGGTVGWVTDCPVDPVKATDSMWTQNENCMLVVKTADCVPVLVADPVQRLVGVIHVGWRGLAAQIVDASIDLARQHGSQPADWLVGIGPAICGKCYAVGKDVFDAVPFARTFQTQGEKWTIDLQREVENLLTEAGVPASQIEVMRMCTFEHPTFFPSWRREKISARLYSCIGFASPQ